MTQMIRDVVDLGLRAPSRSADLDGNPLTEHALARQVVNYARAMGWRVYAAEDLLDDAAGTGLLILVRRPRVVWAKLKGARTPMTEGQVACLTALRRAGQEVFCWRARNWRQIERVLR